MCVLSAKLSTCSFVSGSYWPFDPVRWLRVLSFLSRDLLKGMSRPCSIVSGSYWPFDPVQWFRGLDIVFSKRWFCNSL